MRLDATPLGLPLYEKLGSSPQYELTRYDGRLTDAKPLLAPRHADSAKRRTSNRSWSSIVSNPHRSTAVPASPVWEAAGEVRIVSRDGHDGYTMLRTGSDATQIGPCVAATDAGEWLLADTAGGSWDSEYF